MPIYSRLFDQYSVGQKKCLDIGCGEGAILAHCGPGSLGVDIQQPVIDACIAKGLNARQANLADGIPDELCRNEYDVCILSHVIEHVPAPHALLIDVRKCLRPDGLLILAVPVLNLSDKVLGWAYRRFIRHRFVARLQLDGYLYCQHINFFTPRSLELTAERAGYRRQYLGMPNLASPIDVLALPFAPVVWYVGEKVDNWQYLDTTYMSLGDSGETQWSNAGHLG